MNLRHLDLDDLDAIWEIERRSFRAPWPQPIFVSALTLAAFALDRARPIFGRELAEPTSICLGAFDDDTLRGFLIVSKRADAWDCMNIAVDPDYRRQGVAARLLGWLFELTADDAHRGYTSEVAVSNEASIALCERFGFAVQTILPDYYWGEDAFLMRKDAAMSARDCKPRGEPPRARASAGRG